MFRAESCTLITGDSAIVFTAPISQVLEINGVLVVLLKFLGLEDDTDNIYGVKNGQIIWRVQDKRLYNPDYALPPLPSWTLYGLIGALDDDNTLFFGTTTYGDCFRIDSLTGKIVGYEGWFK